MVSVLLDILEKFPDLCPLLLVAMKKITNYDNGKYEK